MANDVFIDTCFIALFLVFPFFIVLIMKGSGYSLFRFSIPSFALISIFIFAYIGVLPLYFGWDEYRIAVGVVDKYIVLNMFFFNSITLLFMALGIYFSVKIRKNEKWDNIPYRSLSNNEIIGLIILSIISVSVLYVYIMKIPKLALLVALTSGASESKVARSAMGNDFEGSYHWYKLFMTDVISFVCFAFYANHLLIRRWWSKILFLITFLLAAFSAVMAAEKAPLIWFLMGLFLVYVSIMKNNVYDIKKIFFIASIMILILFSFYVFFMGVNDYGTAFLSIFSRAFTGGITPAYFYLEYFPVHHDFLFGSSFPNPGGILPFEPFRLTVEIMNWKFPSLVERGIVGTAPTVFWAEMYANFGVYGVFIAPFFVGVGLHFITVICQRLEKTPIKMAFVSWLALHYMHLSDTSLSGFIFDVLLFSIVVIILLLIVLTNKFKVKFYKKSITR